VTTLWAWLDQLSADHPAAPVVRDARRLSEELVGWSGRPLGVARVDPVLWLALWRVSAVVWWTPTGSRGWQVAGGGGRRYHPLPAADAPAVLWPSLGGIQVFSHRAVWSAVAGTAALEAAGRGLAGPAGFVQGAAAWLGGQAFGTGRWFYADPRQAGAVTDGRERWRYAASLLGVYQREPDCGSPDRAAGDPFSTTDGQLVRSARLFDGWWRHGQWEPARFPGGGWRPVPLPVAGWAGE